MPLFLVNARLSERSLRGYRKIRGADAADVRGARRRGRADRRRRRSACATPARATVAVTGNLKFDVASRRRPRSRSDASCARRFGATRPVWLAASTRDGEEALLLDALARSALPPRTLTVIVPRHPQRFDAVAAPAGGARHSPSSRRSANTPTCRPTSSVVLGDSLGELPSYYAAADVAFVGGSLLPLGGQNLIEPIAVGTPTLVGPHTFNFAEATAQAVAARAALRVADADALDRGSRARCSRDPARRDAMRDAALAFHAAHRGAADRLWALARAAAAVASRSAGD